MVKNKLDKSISPSERNNQRNQQFAQRLTYAMSVKDISAAELCRITDIPDSRMSNYMHGKYLAKQESVGIIARALSVDPLWLVGESDCMEIKDIALEQMLSATEDEAISLLRQLNTEGIAAAIRVLRDYASIERYRK